MKGRWSLYRYVHGLQVSGMPVPAELNRYRYPWATDAEWERQRGARDARAEAACRMRAWAADHLAELQPRAGQAPDTHLGPWVAWLPLAKELKLARFYGRTSEIRRHPWGLSIKAEVDVRAAGSQTLAGLHKAFDKVAKVQLKQMRNPDLRSAGVVTGSEIGGDGFVTMTCTVTDPVAAQKVSNRTFSGLMVSLDGDEVSDVSLVDSPVAFDLEKGSGTAILKIYSTEAAMSKKLQKQAVKLSRKTGRPYGVCLKALQTVRRVPAAPQLPAPVEKALGERQSAETAYYAAPSPYAKAAFQRADDEVRKALIATARPVAVGDAGLINFLRHGRP